MERLCWFVSHEHLLKNICFLIAISDLLKILSTEYCSRPNHRTIFPFGLLVFLIQDQKVLPAGMRDACHLQFCYQKAERHAMQIATSDCTDEWKSEQRDQPLFSLLSSETAHQNLHRLQKPDEQANSCKVKERRISNLYLLFGAKALRFIGLLLAC